MKEPLLKLLLFTGSLFISLAALECGARFLPDLTRSQELDLAMRRQQLDPNTSGNQCKLSQAKAPIQIASLGGSAVLGHPMGPDAAFSKHLDGLLNERFPGKFQVHNLGALSKDSFYLKYCADEIIRHGSLDYIIIYAGHNDFINLGSRYPDRIIFLKKHPALTRALLYVHKHSALLRWLTDTGHEKHFQMNYESFQRTKQTIIRQFGANLDDIYQQAQKNKVTLIVSTLVSNIYERPPFDSVVGPEAVSAAHHFQEAKALYAAGKFNSALAEFKLARDLDTRSWRAPSEFNQFIRDFARERPNILLLDFEKILENSNPQHFQGCNYFGDRNYCDHMHPNSLVHKLIADSLYKIIIRNETLRAPK